MRRFRFRCVPSCTRCCDKTGYVYLTETDLKRAAAFLGMTNREFETEYTYRTKFLLRLRKPPHSQCRFLKADGCAIHLAKPTQCRTYPFWPELVVDRDSWAEAAEECPGIGRGPVIPTERILEIANEMREGYPTLYKD